MFLQSKILINNLYAKIAEDSRNIQENLPSNNIDVWSLPHVKILSNKYKSGSF